MADKKRIQEARQKASDYHNEEQTEPNMPGRQAPRELNHWTDLVGQRIEEAMRQGYFDNLPGRGRPLNLEKNPFVPDDMQMANKLLESNKLVPGWIGERKSVLAQIERFRTKLQETTARYLYAFRTTDDTAYQAELRSQWRLQVEAWREDVRMLNRRIETVNMQQPAAHLEILKLILDDELARAGIPVTPKAD